MPTNLHEPVWNATLSDLIDRNGSVDARVIPEQNTDAPPVRRRLRPFEFDAATGALVLERFRGTTEVPTPCWVGSELDVCLTTERVRLVARHRVAAIEPYALNDRQRVTIMRLTRVGAIASAQRRASFRVETATSDFPAVTLNQPGPDGRKLKPIAGFMVNLSVGGVGVKVPERRFRDAPRPGVVFDFTLPAGAGRGVIHAAVRLCRVQSAPPGMLLLGFEFVMDASQPDHLKLSESIARLTTNLQREQLRKRRGA